jgi:cation transport ATPase
VVFGLALGLMVVPATIFGQPWTPWIYRGLALLIVSCTCAPVVSTPVTIVSPIANAARHGVLIKGGAYLEELGRLKAVALDKTGTLTRGRPEVTDVIPLDDGTPEDLLAMAAALEAQGKTVMLVGSDQGLLGMLALADQIRPESRQAVAALRGVGIRHVALLTGDNRATAEAVARGIGADTVRAEVLPDQKAEVVRALRAECGTLAAFSLLIKAVAIAAVFPGWLTLWLAVLGDMGASVLVTLNGMRLPAGRPTPRAEDSKQPTLD